MKSFNIFWHTSNTWWESCSYCSCLTSSLSNSESADSWGFITFSLLSFTLGLKDTDTSSFWILCSLCLLSRARISLLWSPMATYRCLSSCLCRRVGTPGGSAAAGLAPPRWGRDTGSLWRTSADTSRDSSGGRRDRELHSCLAWDTSSGEEPSNTVKNLTNSSCSGVLFWTDILLEGQKNVKWEINLLID